MRIEEFLAKFVLLSTAEIIQFVTEHRRELQLLFIHAQTSEEENDQLRAILRHLSQGYASSSIDERLSPQIQFLYSQLGLYFKRADDYAGVSNCIKKISPSVLRNRLEAWIHYQLYNDYSHHISALAGYLAKVSAALDDEDESYENEVIRDIHNYYLYATNALVEHGSVEMQQEFEELFKSEALAEQFPVLHFYGNSLDQFEISLAHNALSDKVFEPSLWANRLFQEKIIQPIKVHPETYWNRILMGYSFDEVKSQVINFGQTNFDKQVPGLSGLDMVRLYAYSNMRMHFFAAQHLFERSEMFLTLYQSPGNIKFIDIGCGPATSALAFIDHIHEKTNDRVCFDYIGVDYFQTMRSGAEYFMTNSLFIKKEHNLYLRQLDQLDFQVLEKANSILFNASYLFASEYLNPLQLAKDVLNIRKSQPDCPCYFIFQNAMGASKNARYDIFRENLGSYKTIYSGYPIVPYSNQRNSFSFTDQQVYQEILLLI